MGTARGCAGAYDADPFGGSSLEIFCRHRPAIGAPSAPLTQSEPETRGLLAFVVFTVLKDLGQDTWAGTCSHGEVRGIAPESLAGAFTGWSRVIWIAPQRERFDTWQSHPLYNDDIALGIHDLAALAGRRHVPDWRESLRSRWTKRWD